MFEFFDGLELNALERLLGRMPHRQADVTRQMYEFVHTCRMIMSPLEEALMRQKLTLSRARVLMLLEASADDPQQGLSPGDLAKLAQVRPATMTRLLDGLEEDGFVERVVDLADRRKLRILCTDKGSQAIDAVMLDFADGAQLATADFSHQEIAYMTIIMNKIKASIDQPAS